MKYTHIIWDFNGTILNDVDAGIKSINTLLSRRNLPIVESVDQYKSVFTFPIVEYYKRVGIMKDESEFPVLAIEWVEQYMKYSTDSKLYPGIIELLKQNNKKGIKQIVLSATELNMLRGQLKQLNILNMFDEILGLDNIHAYSKQSLGVKWINQNPNISAVFLGDTEHDYTTANAMGVDCILVANGHQSKETLLKCGCMVIDDIYEINNII